MPFRSAHEVVAGRPEHASTPTRKLLISSGTALYDRKAQPHPDDAF